jgi:hypothetical protein
MNSQVLTISEWLKGVGPFAGVERTVFMLRITKNTAMTLATHP